MATEQQITEPPQDISEKRAKLQPFHGFFSPGISFESGHTVWMFIWSSTPTRLDDYGSVWIITPDGERRIYADPPEAGEIVETWHGFDRTIGASISLNRVDEDTVDLQVEGEDGTTLDFEAELGSSPGTRLLNLITSLTPQPILRTRIGERVSNLSLRLLMDVNGLKVAGITDTYEPYRVEADSMRVVRRASATLDGTNLGPLQPPVQRLDFGDAKVPDEPFFVFGDLFLRPPQE